MAKIVGPGASIQTDVAPDPILQGAHEYEFVELHNPLTDDFQVMVAQDVPVNMPFEIKDKTMGVQTEQDIRTQYGLQLKNPDYRARKYIHNTTVIPAGGSMNFRGNDAIVACRQLVNEIMQREGNRRFISDPVKRNEVEQRVVRRRGNIQDIIDGGITTPQAQAKQAIEKSNEVKNGFPERLNTAATREGNHRQKDSSNNSTGFPDLNPASDSENRAGSSSTSLETGSGGAETKRARSPKTN